MEDFEFKVPLGTLPDAQITHPRPMDCLGQRRGPTHPALLRISFIFADDAKGALVFVLSVSDGAAESDGFWMCF